MKERDGKLTLLVDYVEQVPVLLVQSLILVLVSVLIVPMSTDHLRQQLLKNARRLAAVQLVKLCV